MTGSLPSRGRGALHGVVRALRAALVAAAPLATCHAEALRFCDRPAKLSVEQKDTLFRFGAVIKDELEKSGQSLALMSRSGLDLSRFGIRYSHAGVSLKASQNTPWSVRQLYYACDEGKPRIFDQGLSGFLLGTDDPAVGYVSVVFLPPAQAVPLERAALDNRQALQLLSPTYSANAYPFSLRYQNCNEWVAELLAAAWGAGVPLQADADATATPTAPAAAPRAQAQQWLRAQGYAPTVFEVGALMGLAAFVPWLHNDDHPPEDLARDRFRVSMPASIESFVRAQVPGATRLEFCHTDKRVVVRHGWQPIAEGCVPGDQDTVISLEEPSGPAPAAGPPKVN